MLAGAGDAGPTYRTKGVSPAWRKTSIYTHGEMDISKPRIETAGRGREKQTKSHWHLDLLVSPEF